MTARKGLAAALVLAAGASVNAQDNSAALRDTFSLGTTLEAGRNLDLAAGNEDVSSRLTTAFAYGLSRQSGGQAFDFSLSSSLEASADAVAVDSPRAQLSYRLERARSAFTFAAAYNRSKVTDLAVVLDNAGSIALYEGEGDRAVTTASMGFEGGTDSPLRYSLDYALSDVAYFDTVSASYYDSQTDSWSLGVEADVSPLTVVSLDLQHSVYDTESIADLVRTSDAASLSVRQRIDSITDASVSFGNTRIERVTLADDALVSGRTYGFDLGRDRTSGRDQFGYESAITATGHRETLYLQSAFDRPTGDVSARVGATRGVAGTVDWVGTLNFGTELARDALDFDILRSVTTDDDNNDILNTSVKGAYSHALNEVSRIGFDLAGSFQTGSAVERTRYDASVSYSHTLGYDANLTVGLSSGLSRKEGAADARSQSLYIGLSREFSGSR